MPDLRRLIEHRVAPYLAIAILAVLIYGQSVRYGFSNLDDQTIILDNFGIIGHLSNLPAAFTSDAFMQLEGGTFYRPMQTVSFMLDAAVGGENPWIYHASNVVFHILTCFVLYRLLRKLRFEQWIAASAVLFFCACPLLTHAVAWVPSRGDELIALFGILSFLFLIRFLENRRIADCLLHGGALLAACLSKETALLLPALFLAYFAIDPARRKNWRNIVLPAAVWAVAAGITLFLRSRVITHQPPGQEFGLHPLLINLPVPFLLAGKLFVPINLSTMPTVDTVSVVTGGVAVTVSLLALFLMKGIRRPLALFGGLWFFLLIIPTLLYRHPLADAAYQFFEHRAYLPAAGIIILAAEILRAAVPQKIPNGLKKAGTVLLLVFSVITVIHAGDYSSPERFFTSAIRSNPGDAMAYNNLGSVKFYSGDLSGALALLTKAIQIKPDYAQAYYNRALVYGQIQSFTPALDDYNRSLSYDSTKPMVWFNRAIVRWIIHDREGSLHDCEKAMQLMPGYWIWYFHRGNLENEMGEPAKALSDFDSSIAAFHGGAGYNNMKLNTVVNNESAFSDVYTGRGRSEILIGRPRDAVADFGAAIGMNPKNPDAWHYRGIARAASGDTAGALQDFHASLVLNQNQSQLFIDRAMLKLRLHDREGACADFRSSKRLGDPSADSLLTLYCGK
jgi:protein O-mannosyl-transferase